MMQSAKFEHKYFDPGEEEAMLNEGWERVSIEQRGGSRRVLMRRITGWEKFDRVIEP